MTLTFGATHDGTPYVVGLAAAGDPLLDLAAGSFDELVRAVAARGGTLGMLRSERRLASAADAAALAIDPLTPPELAAELTPLAARLRDAAARP